jgi:hypothetical protein
MKRLHITGCPRSGTTLLVEMVRSCFRCDGAFEHETSVLKPVPPQASLYVTKLPGEFDILPMLMDADRNLHVIVCLRDPRAVIASMHANAPGCYATDYRTWQNCFRGMHSLQKSNRFLCVRYEDLVQAPDDVQRRIGSAFPWLERIGTFSAFHDKVSPSLEARQALNGIRRPETGRLQSWRGHLPRIKEELHYHPEMLRELVECGYEPDQKWAIVLDSVPLREHKVWREPPPGILKRLDRWQRMRRQIGSYLKRAARVSPTDSRTA